MAILTACLAVAQFGFHACFKTAAGIDKRC